MTYTRPEWPDNTYPDFKATAASLGYKTKGKLSKWLLLKKLLAFAKHPQNRALFLAEEESR